MAKILNFALFKPIRQQKNESPPPLVSREAYWGDVSKNKGTALVRKQCRYGMLYVNLCVDY